MRLKFHSVVVVILLMGCVVWAQTKPGASTKPHNFARWEKAIAALEKKDQANPPPKEAALFIGSSTVVRWRTLAQDFPDVKVINHGFGGSEIVDSTYYADRLIFPFEPRQVFLRAGTNDIHGGRTADQVFGDFKDFVAKVHGKLPQTEIVYIANAPAPVRWSERAQVKKLNDLVKDWIGEGKDQKNVTYCETYDMSVAPGDTPREDLFVKDRLHFNEEGYKLLAERVRPFVKK